MYLEGGKLRIADTVELPKIEVVFIQIKRHNFSLSIRCLRTLSFWQMDAVVAEERPKWAGRDSNPRPFGYQPNALAKLSYWPTQQIHITSII